MRADRAEPKEGWADKGDMRGAVQESCVRGKLKVKAFLSVDTVNLNSFHVNPALVTRVTQE